MEPSDLFTFPDVVSSSGSSELFVGSQPPPLVHLSGVEPTRVSVDFLELPSWSQPTAWVTFPNPPPISPLPGATFPPAPWADPQEAAALFPSALPVPQQPALPQQPLQSLRPDPKTAPQEEQQPQREAVNVADAVRRERFRWFEAFPFWAGRRG